MSLPTSATTLLAWCPSCGIVRRLPVFRVHGALVMPWCRHGDPQAKGEQMEPIPSWHPWSQDPDEEVVRSAF